MEQYLIKFTILCVCIIKPIFSLECKVSPEKVQRPGESVTFTCSTVNRNSSIVLRNNGQKMAITSIVEEGSSRTYEVSRVVVENDNFAIFKCSERFAGNAPKAECELKTPLEIAGKAKIDPPYQIISHGDDAVFVCNGETVPAILYYNWWVEKENTDILPADRFVKEDGGRILRIRNVTEDLNQSEIKCRVGNVVEDKRSRANAKSFLFIEGMPMPTNFTLMYIPERFTVAPTSQPNTAADEPDLLDMKLYFIIGAAGALVFSVFFICSLCIIKMKKDHRQDRKKSISKDPAATDKFDDIERARPNSYSELPKNTGKTIEPVSQWKVVAMDSFRGDEEPDFGPAKLYPDLDDEDTNIYENMDTLGNAKGANDNGYASMASMQPNL